MSTEHQPLPDGDESLLEKLSEQLPTEREPQPPQEFYHQYRHVLQQAEVALAHAFHVLDLFDKWRRPMDASTYTVIVHGRVKELLALPDNLRDELMAALHVQNVLLLDTEHECTKYLMTLEAQPRIAAENIVAEYLTRVRAVEGDLQTKEAIHEK